MMTSYDSTSSLDWSLDCSWRRRKASECVTRTFFVILLAWCKIENLDALEQPMHNCNKPPSADRHSAFFLWGGRRHGRVSGQPQQLEQH